MYTTGSEKVIISRFYSVKAITSLLLLLALIGLGSFSSGSHAWEGHQRAPWVGTMLNGTKCDGGQVPFGPYDYLQRNTLKAQLEVVEESHFNEDVESLTKGMSASAMGDIHYTLQTWPNHHRALNSAFRYRLQHREQWGSGDNTAQNYPAECYLQRAIKFSPNDPIPYMLHGMLMHQMKQYEAALKSYRQAIRLRPDDLVTEYNMGLTLVELKKFGEAQKVADKVYAADFPLPGLQRKLAEAKKQRAKARATQAQAPTSAVGNGTVDSEKKEMPKSTSPDTEAKSIETPALATEEDVSTAPSDQKSSPSVPGETTTPVEKAAGKENAASDQQDSGDSTDSTAAPKLTEEQLAILRKALKEQADKKRKGVEDALP
jgi:tetratricopeptide (TPR) repeat protein